MRIPEAGNHADIRRALGSLYDAAFLLAAHEPHVVAIRRRLRARVATVEVTHSQQHSSRTTRFYIA